MLLDRRKVGQHARDGSPQRETLRPRLHLQLAVHSATVYELSRYAGLHPGTMTQWQCACAAAERPDVQQHLLLAHEHNTADTAVELPGMAFTSIAMQW